MRLFKVLLLIVFCSLSEAISHAQPAVFIVTGSGSYCQGENGLVVGLTGSEIDVTYTLFKNGEAQSPTVSGTGGAVDFGYQLYGIYTVSGTNESGTSQMNGEAVIVENEIPTTPVITVVNDCGSSTLSTTAEGELLWSTGATTSSITVTTPGIYTVTTTENGCTSLPGSATAAPMTVPAAPIVSVENNCESSTLSTTAGGTLLWSTGATTSSITVTTAGTYTVTTTVEGCTSSPGSGTASPYEIPTEPDVTVVDNCGSSTLSTDAEGALMWSTGATTSSITVTTAGTYTVTTTVNGCTSSAGSGIAAPRTIPPTPVVTAVNNCGSSTLSTTAAGSLLWNTGATTSSIIVTTPGIYTVTTTENGCTSLPGSATAAPRTFPAAPLVTVVNNCGSSTLSTTAAGTLLWNTGAATSSITVTNAGTYTVTTTVEGCTSSPGSGIASPNEIPPAPVVNVVDNCGSSTLSTNAAGALLWSTGATTSSITVNNAGTYSVTTTVNGCTSSAGSGIAAPRTIPPTPVVTAVNNCGSSTLSTTAAGSLLWNTGATTSSITVTTPGIYTVTTTENGCTSLPGSATAAPRTVPAAPLVTVVNNCGSSTLSTTAAGTLLWNTGAATSSITVTTPGTYSVTTTVNGCTSTAGSGIAAPVAIPPAPAVTVTDNCGSSTLSTNAVGFLTWSTGATTAALTVTTPGTYSVTTTVNGCTSTPGNGTATPRTIPPAPVITVVNNCGSSTLSTNAAGSLLWSTGATTPGITITNAGTYTVTATVSGCTSPSGMANAIPNTIPPPPQIAEIVQPTCILATGSVQLTNLPSSGTWTLTTTPGGTTTPGTGTSTTISGLIPGIYNFTVTTAANCTSAASANVTINAQPPTPATPVIGTITHPTCEVGTGSVVLNGLPATSMWIVTRYPDGLTTEGTGASTTVTGLEAGTYTFTVTNTSGCISIPTGNVVINANPLTPNPPAIGTITQPDCDSATGSAVLTGLPEQGTWLLTGSSGNIAITGTGSSISVEGLETGTYTFTVGIAGGCTSASSGNIVINAQPLTPSAPTAGSIIHPTCSLETGTLSLTGLPSTGTWTLTRLPTGITAGGTGTSATIPGLLPGTYSFTVTNESGCTSPASSGIVINSQPPTPAAPVAATLNHPTCTVNTGTALLEGLPAEGTWSVTLMPGPSSTTGTGTSTTISAMPTGTFSFTVTNSFGCTSQASNEIVVNNQPPTPAAPLIGNIVQPTSDVPTGSIAVNGLPETGAWTLTRNPGGVSTSGTGTGITISGLGAGIYTFNVTNLSGCTSVASNPAGLYSMELYGPGNMTLKPNDTLKISSSEAGSVTISVSSNTDWTVTDNSLWFKAVKDGASSIAVTYLENISAIDKVGSLEVKYTSNPEFVLNIQQKARVSQLKPSKFEDVYLYPNPADDFIYLKLGEEGSGKLRVTITNIQGFIVSAREYDTLTNDQIIEINISGLPAGKYLINIGDNISQKTFRVIKH